MTRNKQTIEVVTVSEERRRRWSAEEKDALVRETYEPGMSVSLVARKHGVGASQLFNWRKLEREGALTAVTAGESVVPASELAAARAQHFSFAKEWDSAPSASLGAQQIFQKMLVCCKRPAAPRNPARWSGNTRSWTPIGPVTLNP